MENGNFLQLVPIPVSFVFSFIFLDANWVHRRDFTSNIVRSLNRMLCRKWSLRSFSKIFAVCFHQILGMMLDKSSRLCMHSPFRIRMRRLHDDLYSFAFADVFHVCDSFQRKAIQTVEREESVEHEEKKTQFRRIQVIINKKVLL